jgi:nucleotide-binding universal stress UspA family protein
MKTLATAIQLRLDNILYATDLSLASERALPYALEIARRYGSTIYALHVTDPDYDSLYPSGDCSKAAQIEEEFWEKSRRDLESKLQSIAHEIIFQPGETWPILSEFIDDKRIDLLVFSTHARTAFDRLLLDSIAEQIVRKAPCSVLAVSPAVTGKPKQNAELNRILYATDFSAESLAAAPYAISIAQEHRAQLVLLHLVEDGEDMPAMLHTLHQLVPLGADLRCEPTCVVERGTPCIKILEVAEGHDADLIVLGVHRDKGLFPKHLIRTGAFRIVTQAKCPVLIARD